MHNADDHLQTGTAGRTVFIEFTDNSTMKKGEQGLPSTGLPYVVVNGTIVVKDNEVLPVKAGKPIRFPVRADWECPLYPLKRTS